VTAIFHLMRHADHGHLGRVLTGRTPGVRLSAEGRRQAAGLAARMAGVRLHALFASPQDRARETAEYLAGSTHAPLRIAPELDEIDFGRWSGCSFAELEHDSGWCRWNEERRSAATPAGETMEIVADRFLGFMKDMRLMFPGRTLGLVTHADVIKAAVCRSLGLPFDMLHEFEIAPASVTTVVSCGRDFRVVRLNERPQLPGDLPAPNVVPRSEAARAEAVA